MSDGTASRGKAKGFKCPSFYEERPPLIRPVESRSITTSFIPGNGYGQKRCPLPGGWMESSAGNFSEVVNVFGLLETTQIACWLKLVQVSHHAVVPNEPATVGKARIARYTDDLTTFVNAVSFAMDVSR